MKKVGKLVNIYEEMRGIKMEHYYTNKPTSKSEERKLEYKIGDKSFYFWSDNGVFSKTHVDIATNFMLNVLIKEKIEGKLLDLGCGYGVIGIILSNFFNILPTMIDVNERALGLSQKNCELNKIKNATIIESDGFEKIDKSFNVIVTNPPIRAGKKNLYNMYKEAFEHLEDNGCLYLVINKKHGAPSTKEYLIEVFGNCEVLDKKAGFQVLKCVKTK